MLSASLNKTFPSFFCVQSIDGIHVCAALQSQYLMINSETSHTQDLFPYDSEQINPVIKRINKVSEILFKTQK